MAKKDFKNGDPIVTPQPSNPNSPKMTGRTVEKLPGGDFKKVTKTKMINTPNEQTSSTKTKTVRTLRGAVKEVADDVSYGLEKVVGKVANIKNKREEKQEQLESLRKGNSQAKEAALKYSKDAYDAINFKNKDVDKFKGYFNQQGVRDFGNTLTLEEIQAIRKPKP